LIKGGKVVFCPGVDLKEMLAAIEYGEMRGKAGLLFEKAGRGNFKSRPAILKSRRAFV
jgi:hypothetical protein